MVSACESRFCQIPFSTCLLLILKRHQVQLPGLPLVSVYSMKKVHHLPWTSTNFSSWNVITHMVAKQSVTHTHTLTHTHTHTNLTNMVTPRVLTGEWRTSRQAWELTHTWDLPHNEHCVCPLMYKYRLCAFPSPSCTGDYRCLITDRNIQIHQDSESKCIVKNVIGILMFPFNANARSMVFWFD